MDLAPGTARATPVAAVGGGGFGVSGGGGGGGEEFGAGSDAGRARVTGARRLESAELAMSAENEHRRLATVGTPLDTVSGVEALLWVLGCLRVPEERWRRRAVTIRGEFGLGITTYFRYVEYLGLVNVLLAVLGVVAVAYAGAVGEGLNASGEYPGLESVFLAAFPAQARGAWYAVTAVALLVGVGAGPAYHAMFREYSERWRGEGRVEEREQVEDEIRENALFTNADRSCRQSATVAVVACMCAANAGIMYWLHSALQETSSGVKSTIIALTISVLNMLWVQVARFLTELELHRTRTQYTEWAAGKVFVVRVLNLITLYAVKQVVAVQRNQERGCPSSSPDCQCPLDDQAWQFFMLVLVDISVGNLVEILGPMLIVWANRRCGLCSRASQGDGAIYAPFDLTDEFSSLFYRQTIVYLGITTFPLMGLLGLLSCLLEYWLDKYRLVALSEKPTTQPNPVRPALILAVHLFITLVAILTFPSGAAWVFAQYEAVSTCSVFQDER